MPVNEITIVNRDCMPSEYDSVMNLQQHGVDAEYGIQLKCSVKHRNQELADRD